MQIALVGLVFALAPVVTLCGCAAPKHRPEEPIRILQGLHGPDLPRGIHIVREVGAWQAMWSALGRNQLPAQEAPTVDFQRELIALVTLGEKPTGGFGVRVSGLRDDGDRWILEAEEVEPASGSMQVQMLTSPFDLVRLQRTSLPIEVEFTATQP